MKCPKCGYNQSSEIECESCGIVFKKYHQFNEKIKNKTLGNVNFVDPKVDFSGGFELPKKFYLLVGFALFIVVSASMLIKSDFTPNKSKLSGISKQLYSFHKPRNNVERAQLATVFIKTPWGLGSGFFISKDCQIISNKHVVKLSDEAINDLRSQILIIETLIENTKKKISEAQQQSLRLENEAAVSYLNGRINISRKNLENMENKYDEIQDNLNSVENGLKFTDYTIFLFDKSEYKVSDVIISKKYDLALLKLNQSNCPPIKPANTQNVRVGQSVYTIGNPLGLSHTVTSGIISGERMNGNTRYLQTDAPINPGNSGGPLINKKGEVMGVNTMILKNSEGIGFTIPIEIVLKEFGLLK